MDDDIIAEKVYVGECEGSYFVSCAQMKWNVTVKNCLRKRGMDIR